MTTDQAGLHGHLQKVRDIGIPLVPVTSGDPDHPDPSTLAPHQGAHHPTKENDMTLNATHVRVPMDSVRKAALIGGALYVITFATSIPSRILFGPVRNDPNYILGPGADGQVLFAGLLELMLAVACIGTAVALWPVLKRQNEGVALGFLGSRTLEAAIIVSGLMCLLSVVSLRQSGAGVDALATSQALVSAYNWAFLFGPGFMAVANALLLGSILYRSRLVPRILPVLGLVGAPLLFASDIAVMFGVWEQFSVPAGIATVPIFVWELSLGIYLVVKGFKPSPATAGLVAASPRPTQSAGVSV